MFRSSFCFLASAASSSSSLDLKAAFKILGLSPSPSTTPEDARQRYLKLARQYHPDVSNGDDTKMKQVNLAYEVVQNYAATSGGDFSLQQQQGGKRKSRHEMSAAEEAAAAKNDDGFGADDDDFDNNSSSSNRRGSTSWREKRQAQKKRKSNLGDATSWNTRPEFEWNEAIFNVSEAESSNPRNHPGSFNRHFSFNDDSNIFKAVRSGATVEEVARSMGRSSFAIEARMNSTQFKLRIQKMLKSDQFQRRNKMTREDLERNARATSSSSNFTMHNDDDENNTNANNDDGEHDDDTTFANGRKKNQKIGARGQSKINFSRQLHPYQDTVYRNPVPQRKPGPGGIPHENDQLFMHPEEIEEAMANDGRFLDEADDENDNTFGQFSSKNIQSAHGRSYHHLMNSMKGKRGSGGSYSKRRFE